MTIGAEEEGGDTTRALMVSTPTLNKGVATVDDGAITEPTKAVGILTSATTRAVFASR